MITFITALLWISDIILDGNNGQIILFSDHLCKLINIRSKRADNTDTAFVAGHEIGGSGTNSPTVTISEKQAVGTGKAVALSVNVYETEKKANKKYYYYNFFKVNQQ